MSLTAFLSSFIPVAYCDAPEEKEEEKPEEEAEEKEEGGEDAEEEEEEEEEEEPEDELPAIREECQESAKCAPITKHFLHCQEKVEAGEGFQGEDCVEEIMMHCVDNCAAPKLFGKLR